jgi:hypothetical protein
MEEVISCALELLHASSTAVAQKKMSAVVGSESTSETAGLTPDDFAGS